MTEQEIRARALELSLLNPPLVSSDPVDYERLILKRAERFMVYIRLGMEGVEGMLKEAQRE